MQPEMKPSSPQEQSPGVNAPYEAPAPQQYEQFPTQNQERREAYRPPSSSETGVERKPANMALSQPQIPLQPAPTADDSSSATTGTPGYAADEDLIEKEWVDKAKQVIEETKDDPRAREKAIGALQRDYLMKRYGKVIGATED